MKQMVAPETTVLEKEDTYILDRIIDFATTVEKEITPPIPAARLLIDTVERAVSLHQPVLNVMFLIPL